MAKESDKKTIWRRTSCDDEECCQACKDADGSIISGPDEDLSKICTNPEGCRCLQYSDLTEKDSEK